MAIVIVILFIGMTWGAMNVGKHLPKRVQIGVIVALSLVFALLHWAVARTQLDVIGFAARNRTPDHPAEIIGYLLAVLGLINIVLVFKRVRYAAMVLGVLIVVFPVLYFVSW